MVVLTEQKKEELQKMLESHPDGIPLSEITGKTKIAYVTLYKHLVNMGYKIIHKKALRFRKIKYVIKK